MSLDYFNLMEGCYWVGLGVLAAWRIRRPVRRYLLTADMVIFGLSDFVEMQTGAWWRPWWLLVWKASCIGFLLFIIIHYLYERRPLWRHK